MSVMWMIGSLGAAFGTPFYGVMIDRLGARTMVPVGLVGLCLAMLTLASSGFVVEENPNGIYLLPPAFFMMRSCANGMGE